MYMYNIITYYRVKCCYKTLLVQLVDFSPVGFGRVVFWSSCRLVELSFGRVDFGRPVGGRVVEFTDYPKI
jgi:hypothetical protein